jgi:hypothetical protein
LTWLAPLFSLTAAGYDPAFGEIMSKRDDKSRPLLAVYRDTGLSPEATEQLAIMFVEVGVPVAGTDLTTADRKALLQQHAPSQPTQA